MRNFDLRGYVDVIGENTARVVAWDANIGGLTAWIYVQFENLVDLTSNVEDGVTAFGDNDIADRKCVVAL